MIEESQDFELDLLSGRILSQIRVGLHQLVFCFDEESTVSCESQVQLRGNQSKMVETVFPPASAIGRAVDLLGNQIVDIRLDESENVCIKFSSGDEILIECENKGYESYQIYIGNDFLIA